MAEPSLTGRSTSRKLSSVNANVMATLSQNRTELFIQG